MTQTPPQYVVRDTAGNIYGPATVAMLREWIGEGRLTVAMSVAEQGSTQYAVAGTIPQLREAFARAAGAVAPQSAGLAAGGVVRPVGMGQAGAASPVTRAAGNTYGVAAAPSGGAGPAQRPYDPNNQGYVTQPANHPLAVTSLILGLVGIPGLVFCPISFVAELLAVIFGHLARGQIRREPERYGGAGMATAGMIIGYCMLGLLVLGVVAYILFFLFAVGAAAAGAAHPPPRPGRPF